MAEFNSNCPLFVAPEHRIFKPFAYDWAYEYWLMQRQIAWLPEEVPMHEDVKDWRSKLTPEEVNLVTQIFRFFVQADVEVGGAYLDHYCKIFQPTEIRMMLIEFMATESLHVASYSHLLSTIGMPDVEYSAFLGYKEMKDKYDYMKTFSHDTVAEVMLTIAAFAAFTEGLQLYASFAMLLNFPRFGKMKGMGQIITWSVRDEALHVKGMLQILKELVSYHPVEWQQTKTKIPQIAATIVDHEKEFIKLAFSMGKIEGMDANTIGKYMEYIADRRLIQLGVDPIYKVDQNPLPWLDDQLNAVEHANFFEQRSTNYSRGATSGTWEEAFQIHIL